MNWFESIHGTQDNFGLIHFDFELDNLCWDDDGVIQMLDFDDCSYYWYAADIALALRDLFHEKVDYKNVQFKSFLAGYRSQCAIDDVSLGHLPMFLRMSNLVGYADLVRVVDISFAETHNWLRPLHEKLTHFIEKSRLAIEAHQG